MHLRGTVPWPGLGVSSVADSAQPSPTPLSMLVDMDMMTLFSLLARPLPALGSLQTVLEKRRAEENNELGFDVKALAHGICSLRKAEPGWRFWARKELLAPAWGLPRTGEMGPRLSRRRPWWRAACSVPLRR